MSIKIEISNYEVYVLDYIDGALPPDTRLSFESFLAAHPTIANEIEELETLDLTLDQPKVEIDKKALMMELNGSSHIHEDNYEMAFAIEPESATVTEFVELNPKLEREARLYAATRLKPDPTITFGAKSELKKALPIWEVMSNNTWRAAAAILVLIGLISVLNNVEQVVYSPRQDVKDYVSFEDQMGAFETVTLAQSNAQDGDVKSMARTTQDTDTDELELLPKKVEQSTWSPGEIENRPTPSYAFQAPKIIENSSSEIAKPRLESDELSIAQLIGKEVLGIDPAKAQTTQALIKESAKKIIDQTDQLALDSEQTKDKRKIFRLKVAGIEFRRVRYLASN